MKFKLTVNTIETVYSRQVLMVDADTPEQAKEIAEEDQSFWRNGQSSDRTKIIEEEEPEHIELESLEYEVEAAG